MNKIIRTLAVTTFAALLWFPIGANATVTVTEPATDDIQSSNSTVYYIYNESAGAWLTKGGTWGTHAVVADFQATTSFQWVTAGSGSLTNSWIHVQANTNGKDLFPNNTATGETYTDGGSNNRWVITKSDDGTYYKIANTNTGANYSPSGTYLGLGANNANVRSNVTEDATTKWKFIIAANIDIFRAKMAMYKLIVTADALVTSASDGDAKTTLSNALTTAQTNYASYTTADNFTTGAATLKSAIWNFKTASASTSNPVDVSYLGENMTFSKVTPAAEANGYQDLPAGWTQTTFVGTGTKQGNYGTLLNSTSNVYYFENSYTTGYTGKISQTISSLPAGIYRVTMKAFGAANVYSFEQNNDYKSADLSSGTAAAPTDVVFNDTLSVEGAITFGLNSKSTATTTVEMGLGDVTLYYLGFDPTAAIATLTTLYNSANTTSVMNADVKSALTTAMTAAKSIIDANTGTETAISNAYDNLNAAITNANASIASYTSLNCKISSATTLLGTTTYEKLSTAIANAQNVYNAATATDAEVTSQINALNVAMLSFNANSSNVSASNPYAMTSQITNANLTSGKTGWTESGTADYKNGYNELEFYSNNVKNFTLSQTLAGLPAGYYKLQLQGFERNKSNDAAAAYKAGTETIATKLFVSTTTDGEKTTPITSIYSMAPSTTTTDYSNGYPDKMWTAQTEFTNGNFTANEISFYKSTDTEDLTFGIRNEGTVNGAWTIIKSFTLNYYGDATASTTINGNEAASYSPTASTGDITLNRTLNTTWNTICLPFDVAGSDIATYFGAGTSVASLDYIDDSYNLYFSTRNPQIKANVPCLIKLPASATSVTVNKAIVSASGAGSATYASVGASLVGTYDYISNVYSKATTTQDAYIFAVKSGDTSTKLYKANTTGIVLKPTRAYYLAGNGASAKSIDINIDGNEVTAIEGITTSKTITDGKVYNLNGQLISTHLGENMSKGIYIVNGNKMVIK